jgi:multidrug efflux pump subunit AcrA (membrane-fusion protein)
MKKKWWIWVAAALVLLVVVRVATKHKTDKSKTDLPIAVKVMPPRSGAAEELLSLSGTITAEEEANAYSKVPGKLSRFVKAEGDRVEKDETIAWVERDEVGLTYSLSPVKAPIAGLVAQKLVEIGESVSPGGGMPGTPVALVVNPRRLEVDANVVERDLAKVSVGQEARIRVEAYPEKVFLGRVQRMAPIVDRTTKMSRIVISLQAPEKLVPGMFADIDLILGRKNQALMLPREAVLQQNQKSYIYIADQGRAVRKEIGTGWLQGGEIEVVKGVTPQDLVVVEGQTRLVEGAHIQIAEKAE